MAKPRSIGFDSVGIARARARGKRERKNDAVRVRYDSKLDQVFIALRNGTTVAVPRHLIVGLRGFDRMVAAKLRVSRVGDALEIPKLDIHISVGGLVRKAVLGGDPYAQAGRTRSSAKAAAARTNGAKGGRPKVAA